MKYLLLCCAFLSLNACVTKGKYDALLHDISSKEKQQVKLQKQLDEQKSKNDHLRDSARQLGGEV
jgi:cell division protein FtsB